MAGALIALSGGPREARAGLVRTPEGQADLLIKGGRVIDGMGNAWRYADVAIRGNRVLAIADDIPTTAALAVIDAKGMVVAPGFIDVHTHADDDLRRLPEAENFVRNGVTSIVTGNCGGSVRNVARYFDDLVTTGCALNVATLVGHNSVLRAVKGNVAKELSPEQLEKGRGIVRRAMEEGAIGFSTGLIYTPGKYSKTEEIIELARESGKLGGIYATHMRSESTEVLEAIDEALRIGRESGSRVQISHFKVRSNAVKGGSETTLAKVLAARDAGQEVWVDQYPYTASSTSLSTMLPDWVAEEGEGGVSKILSDPEKAAKVCKEIAHQVEVGRGLKDMSYAVIASSTRMPRLNGMNMKIVAQRFKVRNSDKALAESGEWLKVPVDKLPEVTMLEQAEAVVEVLKNGGASCVFHGLKEEDVQRIMASPLVAIASDSGVRRFGSGVPHPRGYGTNSRVLGRYVRELRVITLEDAIRKMTSMPATAFRIAGRGVLTPGAYADVVIFDPETVADRATYDNPHQYPVGIRDVIVNGKPVLRDGALTGALPGTPIYGPGRKQAR